MHRSFRAAVLATTALLFPAYAYAQGGIVQSGVVTRGHAPVWAGNGTLSDGGTATSSFISTLGITSAVFPSFAISTTSAVSPENILQMGVTSTGATIDLENPGTTALPLIFENNGFPELTLDSTGTVHISSLIVGTISISSFSFANPTFTGSMLFTSTQVYNSPTIAVPSITNFVENLSGTIGGGTLSPKVPNPFYNTQTITNGVTLNNAGGAYGWHWKETLNNAVGTNSVGLVELTQANATPADNGRTSSFESMGFYVTMNGLAGGTLPAQGLSNGFVYGTNPKTILQDGAQNYSLINNWGEGDVAISPVVRPIFASGSVTVGETDTIELVSTACGFPGGIALTATAAAGDTLGILLNKFGSQILMNDVMGVCGIGMALAGATSGSSNTLDITAPPNNISGVVDLTITFPPPSGGTSAVYTLGTATLGASAQAKFGMTFVELKKDGVAGAAQNSVIGVAKQAGGSFPPTSGGWNSLVTFIGTTNQFSPDDTTVVPGQWPLDRLFNGVVANIPTQYAGTNDTPLQFPRMSSFLDLPNVEFLISDITTGLGPIVFPGYMLKGDGSEWIGSGTIQRLVGNAGTVGIQIQANGWEGTAIAVSNGGGPGAGTLTGHYYVNDITTCGFGDFEKVTATTATGGISTISVINDGTRFDWPSSGPGSAPSATCHPLGGSGTGAVYTITWSAGNTVTVGNSGGTVNLLGVVNGGTLGGSFVTPTGGVSAVTLSNLAAVPGVPIETFFVAGDPDYTAAFGRAAAANTAVLLGPHTYTVNNFTTGATTQFIVRGIPGKSIIQRTSAGGGSDFFTVSAATVDIEGVVFDMNRAVVTANQFGVYMPAGGQTIVVRHSKFVNNSGTNGGGLMLTSTGPAAGGSFTIQNDEFANNAGFAGLYLGSMSNGLVDGVFSHGNAQYGILAASFGAVSGTNYSSDIQIVNSHIATVSTDTTNQNVGIQVGGLTPPYTLSTPRAQRVVIANNLVQDIVTEGIVLTGDYLTAVNNQVSQSSGLGITTFEGIICVSRHGTVSLNTVTLSGSGFGIDCGAAIDMKVTDNTVTVNHGNGINAGANQFGEYSHNTINLSGSGSVFGISIFATEADGNSVAFPTTATGTAYTDNTINITGSTAIGIRIVDDAGGLPGAHPLVIRRNHFNTNGGTVLASQAIAWNGSATSVQMDSNDFNGIATQFVDPNGSGDVLFENVYIGGEIRGLSSTSDIRAIETSFINTYGGGGSVLWVYPTGGSSGSGYVQATTTLTESGTGCTGWTGTPLVYGGAIIGVRTNAVGSGCSGAATITATDSSGGTGATFVVGQTPTLPEFSKLTYSSTQAHLLKSTGGFIALNSSVGINMDGTTQVLLQAPPAGTVWNVLGYTLPFISLLSLPACDAAHANSHIFVSGSATGKSQAHCNSTNWLWEDGTIVS